MALNFEQGRVEGRRQRLTAAFLTLAAFGAVSGAPAVELDTARDQDPRLEPIETPVETVAKFADRLKPLWLEALARPEADLKCQAAGAIARAHHLGMPGLEEAVPRLLDELEATNAQPIVRLAAASALIALDARRLAPVLMKHAQSDGLDAARLIEPALARWDFAAMRPVWLARLADAQAPRGPLVLALRASATANLHGAAPHLRQWALNPGVAEDIRLEAARALAVLQQTGLERDARLLAADPPARVFDCLIAATLLAHHRGAEAEALLLRLAAHRTPAVAAVAMKRLLEVDPVRLKPLLDERVKSPDTGLRQLAAQGLVELRTEEAVLLLGPLLDDPHVDVREFARESLVRLAAVRMLADPVSRAAMGVAEANGPRGLEQAATVIGAIRHEPAARRLLQLLDHDALEVRIAAAWALRRLAVPATAASILERVRIETGKFRQRRPDDESTGDICRDLEHLIEALGALRYRPAEPVLRQYLPPPPKVPPVTPGLNPIWQPRLRAAALWSLGHICAAQPPADLVAILRERLHSDGEGVRVMAAVGLGHMKAKECVPELRQFYQDEKSPLAVRAACAWSLHQINGQPVPAPKVPLTAVERWYSEWFLEPLGSGPKKGGQE